MTEWEYKVQTLSFSDHPFFEGQNVSVSIEAMLMEIGKEGWELVHIKDVDGRWRSNPEKYPGGDPGRMTWEYGTSILYFKRPKAQEKKPIPVPKGLPT